MGTILDMISADFVLNGCQRWRRVHLYQLTDVKACFFSPSGVMVRFVSLLSGFSSLCGVEPHSSSSSLQPETKCFRRIISISVDRQCRQFIECS